MASARLLVPLGSSPAAQCVGARPRPLPHLSEALCVVCRSPVCTAPLIPPTLCTAPPLYCPAAGRCSES